ncbi:MAG: hypothetical protein EON90_05360 [Brevundimonas sp.]|nr:MAG: hypothetical protein EON90_05360 [Brevundimonas sp.]
MISRFRGRETLILAVGLWVAYALLEISVSLQVRVIAFVWAAHGLALMLVMSWLLRRALRSRWSLLRVVACVVLPLVFAAVQTALDIQTTYWIGDRFLDGIEVPEGFVISASQVEYWFAFKLSFKAYLWVFGFYSVTVALLSAVDKVYQARLEALRLQIAPHFLFNALNSVSSLIVQGRHEDAGVMTVALARYYHNNLLTEDDRLTRLGDELEAVDAYAELERVRAGSTLTLSIDCPDPLYEARIASLLLQPLVENAIKHGGAGPEHPLVVSLKVRSDGNLLRIEVSNLIARHPVNARGTGTGLANVQKRLRTLYGRRARAMAGAIDDHWRVSLSLPLVTDMAPASGQRR